MNKTMQRIELAALAEDNNFILSLVKNKYDYFIRVISEARKLSINLTNFGQFEEIQREMLDNKYFLKVLFKILKSRMYSSSTLNGILLEMKERGDSAVNYSPEQFYEAFSIKKYLENNRNTIKIQYVFLKYFSGKGLTENKMVRIAKSLVKLQKSLDLLNNCFKNERSIGILSSKYFSEVSLADNSIETLELLVNNKNACKFMVYLFSKGYSYIGFHSDELKQISDNFDMIIPNLKQIYFAIGYSRFKEFISYWRENGLSLPEVQMLVKRLDGERPAADTFDSKVSYINYLCGSRLRDFEFEDLRYGQSEILIYAILNNKKSFLRLVKDNYKLFTYIPADSVLFNVTVYKTIINLNTLNARNLKEISKMLVADFQEEQFENYNYTFDEFKVLYNAEEQYGKLYNLLKINRIDDKLVVIRELLKRNLLSPNFSDEEYEKIADKLSIMPLSRWYKEEYLEISDLVLGDVVNILANYSLIEKFRREIKTRKDVYCIIRNKDYAKASKNLKDMVNKIIKNDSAWLELKEVMELTDEFITNNKKTIADFVFNGSAAIANDYYTCLSDKYKSAFFSVVKADMLGKLKELKYFPGDLAKEIDYPVTDQQEKDWAQTLITDSDKIIVKECDSFEDTMKMGVNPVETCMSYHNGGYRECLISNFDCNKKILYAYINGVCVARAILRLTKGSYKKGASTYAEEKLRFAEINDSGEFENVNNINENEHLTIFLERMYSAGINNAVVNEIVELFVSHAIKKAEVLDAECVVSTQYNNLVEDMPITSYRMYISRSKAGWQYLDSLGGSASVSDERTMKNTVVYTAGRKDNGQI